MSGYGAFGRFLLIGSAGFAMDAALTYVLIVAGLAPWLARIPAIAGAMSFTWLANRRFTYRVRAGRSAGEAFRYTTVALTMAMLNYTVFGVLIAYKIPPMAAVTVATALQTIVSFYAYRRFAFVEPS